MKKKGILFSVIAAVVFTITLGFTSVFAMNSNESPPLVNEKKTENPTITSKSLAQDFSERKHTQRRFTVKRFENEQKAQVQAKFSKLLEQGLTEGKITQELYDLIVYAIENGEMPELTDEQKAEMLDMISNFKQNFTLEKVKEHFREDFSDDDYTHKRFDGKIPEMTDEQRAEIREKLNELYGEDVVIDEMLEKLKERFGEGFSDNNFPNRKNFNGKIPKTTDKQQVESRNMYKQSKDGSA